jgi:Zn-dependent protease with chaperone function
MDRFFAVLAHELGHVVYRDNSRLEWLKASIVLPFLLIATTLSPLFYHRQNILGIESICTPVEVH